MKKMLPKVNINYTDLPSVSIIIVVYNAGEYIEKCLDSVVQQTYRGKIECILVNDCSTDGSIEKASNIINAYNGAIKFRIINHENNKGAAASRNTGIKNASGTWIYFLDHDDWIVPRCIELMIAETISNPEVQIVFAGAETTSGHYDWLDFTKKTLPEHSNDQSWLRLSMLRRFDFGMTAWNKLVSRKFVLENGLRFVEGLVHEDEAWNFDLSKHIQSASFVKQNTYIYNVHNDSIVTSASDDIRWKRMFALWYVLLSKLDENNKEIQIRAISSCILEKIGGKIPQHHRIPLCKLFYKLSTQTHGILSLLLFVQGTLALCIPSRFKNHYTFSRIRL